MSEEGIKCSELWSRVFRLYGDAGIMVYRYLSRWDDRSLTRAINRLELLTELLRYGTEKGCMKDTENFVEELKTLIKFLRGGD